MPRTTCPQCHYPTVTCVCAYIEKIEHHTEVIVLQHPSEVNNKKNTLRLVTLMSDNIEVVVGEVEQDFTSVLDKLTDKSVMPYLLFPDEKSQTWSELQRATTETCTNNNQSKNKNILIVIDGTWRKAKKIHLLNKWLKNIPTLTLAENKKTNYGIRKSKLEHGLSSIEAIAFALEDIEKVNPAPFLTALTGLKQVYTKLMPNSVKQRYS